jgi:TPP-dependent pyruvate/acetoin dehydrogenase alpha subunit
MPREKISLPAYIEHLSILNEYGHVDDALLPNLSEEQMLRIHRTMLLGWRVDERLLVLQRPGRIGTFAPIKGREAAQIGTVATLRKEDWLVSAS